MAQMTIRKGDNVLVISGKDRGKVGKVMRAFPQAIRVMVEGVNLVTRHTRQRQRQKGQRISVPMAIDRSNVMLVCPHCNKPTRIESRITADKKQRACRRCNEIID